MIDVDRGRKLWMALFAESWEVACAWEFFDTCERV